MEAKSSTKPDDGGIIGGMIEVIAGINRTVKNVAEAGANLSDAVIDLTRIVKRHSDRLDTLEERTQALADAVDEMESDWSGQIGKFINRLDRIEGNDK